MTHAEEMLHTHPTGAVVETGVLGDCIEACSDCAQELYGLRRRRSRRGRRRHPDPLYPPVRGLQRYLYGDRASRKQADAV